MAGAQTTRLITLGAIGTLFVLAGASFQGCAGYSSYPHASGSLTRRSTNTRSAIAVMRESLRWTTRRTTGVPERFAINLPQGVGAGAYASIASAVGGEALRASNADLPRYSITRVWVRSGQAKVDVVRPVLVLGKNADGRYPTQGITIELEGGLEPWRVVRYRPWAIGTLADAPANYIDGSDSYGADDGALDGGAPYAHDTGVGDESDQSELASETEGADNRGDIRADTWNLDDEVLPGGRPEASVPTDAPDVIEINP